MMEMRYGDYLNLDKMLTLQQPLTPTEHDENLFIIVHQICELWFKQIIQELLFLKTAFDRSSIFDILHTLKRIKAILKILVSQFDIFETLNFRSFYQFRKNLGNTSGFQSSQFREIEFLLGLKNKQILQCFMSRNSEHEKLEERFNASSIWEDFLVFSTHYIGDNLAYDNKENLSETQKIAYFIYRYPSVLTEIAEMLVDLDEGLQEWRYRHVKMTERAIGHGVQGTGGSSGMDYLKKSLFQSFCPELWQVRSLFSEH